MFLNEIIKYNRGLIIFRQQVLIAALVKLGVINADNVGIYSVQDIATGLQVNKPFS